MSRRPGPLEPAAYARLFEGAPDGPAVLDELMRIYSKGVSSKPGIDGIVDTYRNIGAREVIEFIVRKINVANHGVPPDDDRDDGAR